MKRKIFILLIFITTGTILLADRNFRVEEKEEIRKTLNFQDPSKSKELVVDGNIEVTFLEDLSANFRLKTFNGDAYSDFPFSYTPAKPAVQGRKKGKYVYKSDRFIGVRIGKGGPEIKMDTLNGDILIAKKK